MNALILLATLFALSSAKPLDQLVAVTHDTSGNYEYKYVLDGITKSEQADELGNIVGGYSYVDPDGVLKKISYTSGVNGFVPTGLDIPVQVPDTEEVALAKQQHLALLNAAYLSAPRESQHLQSLQYHQNFIPMPLIPTSPLITLPPLANPFLQVQVPNYLQHGETHVIPDLKYFVLKGAIEDTPEVVAARNAHFLAYLEAHKKLHL